MFNPDPSEIEDLMRFRLVGFNCRRYDNHILYARLMGYDNDQLYKLSQKIINGSPNCFFGEAYNVSYTDVYDFSSKKQSLKKFEIELGLRHRELGLRWDQPAPEELWIKVAEYCDNDVIATEATFNARRSDFLARQILADIAGMTVNDTTNILTTKIIFGSDKKPQDQFNYRDMGKMTEETNRLGEYTVFDEKGRPIFPGYTFENGKSIYRGEEVGEGGYVYSEPGMYGNVALLDIASMHPNSIVAENLFGDKYTKRFNDLLDTRMAIKHRDFDNARKMLNGALTKYLTDENAAADLAYALKIAINSIYGLTSASFDNPFHDHRNKDNIVAKRGALFMINLKHEVQSKGFIVAHVKTDSIKIPDVTQEIIKFIMDYGKIYGYTFEYEATYDRFCLVNNAVYIAKYKDGKHANEWTATGTQFQVPYVFKKLFSREEIVFEDMCEIKAVTSALYLDRNEGMADDEHKYHFIGKVGQFCPMKEGIGGGILLRETTNSKTGEKGYAAVTGSKGFRWLESEMVRELSKEADIERGYYDKMVDEAVKSISEFGDFEWFISEDPYINPRFTDGKHKNLKGE
jgi:DNA polymerase elongation subunit (family B)